MNTTHTVNQNGTGIPLIGTLTVRRGEADLRSVAEVRLTMKPKGSQVPKIADALCQIISATSEKIVASYTWQSSDVNTVGEFSVSFTAILPNGQKISFPRAVNSEFGTVIVNASL